MSGSRIGNEEVRKVPFCNNCVLFVTLGDPKHSGHLIKYRENNTCNLGHLHDEPGRCYTCEDKETLERAKSLANRLTCPKCQGHVEYTDMDAEPDYVEFQCKYGCRTTFRIMGLVI